MDDRPRPSREPVTEGVGLFSVSVVSINTNAMFLRHEGDYALTSDNAVFDPFFVLCFLVSRGMHLRFAGPGGFGCSVMDWGY